MWPIFSPSYLISSLCWTIQVTRTCWNFSVYKRLMRSWARGSLGTTFEKRLKQSVLSPQGPMWIAFYLWSCPVMGAGLFPIRVKWILTWMAFVWVLHIFDPVQVGNVLWWFSAFPHVSLPYSVMWRIVSLWVCCEEVCFSCYRRV